MPKEKYFKGKKLNKNALIAEREKRKLYFKYKKSLKKEKKGLNKSETEKATNNVSHEKTAKKDKIQNQQENKPIMSSYKKVQIQYETKAKEQEEKFQESKKRKLQSDEALKRYKKLKKESYHNLCKKTSRGQLLMGAKIESLLKKIEQSK